MKPAWSDVRSARRLLSRYFAPTRLLFSSSLGREACGHVYLKLESEMPTGSFKVRAALYALHKEMTSRPVSEVVASSTGNHGAAVAYAGKRLNVPVKIFLPRNAIYEVVGRVKRKVNTLLPSGWEGCQGRPFFGRSSRPLTALPTPHNGARNQAERSSVQLRSMAEGFGLC